MEKIMLGSNFKTSKKFPENIVEGAICLDILNDEKVEKLIYEFEGKQYLNVKICKRKEASEFGATHYIEIDQFQPKAKEAR